MIKLRITKIQLHHQDVIIRPYYKNGFSIKFIYLFFKKQTHTHTHTQKKAIFDNPDQMKEFTMTDPNNEKEEYDMTGIG